MASGGKGLRFYGVVDADAVDPAFLRESGLSQVTYRDLTSVVTPAPYVRETPDDAELQEYIQLIDALSARGPVIPAPPGTVFRDDSVLKRWLDVHYAKLHEALGLIEHQSDGRAPYDYVRMELGA